MHIFPHNMQLSVRGMITGQVSSVWPVNILNMSKCLEVINSQVRTAMWVSLKTV